jgi:hypothetical protein
MANGRRVDRKARVIDRACSVERDRDTATRGGRVLRLHAKLAPV